MERQGKLKNAEIVFLYQNFISSWVKHAKATVFDQ